MAEILLYGEVSEWWDSVNAKDTAKTLVAVGEDDVTIRVMSGGGDVFEGLSIYNSIKAHKGKTTVHVDGLAASIASYFIMAADEIVVHENSHIMIHNPWTFACGESGDLRKQADVMDKLRDTLVDGYHARTGLERDVIVEMMNAETWMSADEAVEQGFADRVEKGGDFEDIENSVGAKIFNHFTKTPDEILAKFRGAAKMSVSKKNAVKRDSGSASRTAKNEIAPETEDEIDEAAADVATGVDEVLTEAIDLAADEETDEATALEILEAVEAIGESVEVAKELMKEKASMNRVRHVLHARMAAKYKKVNAVKGSPGRANVGVESSEKRIEAMALAVAARGNTRIAARNEFSNLSLFDIARDCVSRGGGRIDNMSRDEIISRAIRPQASGITHTTSDFPLIMETAFRTTVMREFAEIEQTYTEWTSEGSLPDFNAHMGVGVGAFSNLVEMKEGEEYTFGTFGEHGEKIQVATWGRMVGLSRQMIRNDQLAVFGKAPRLMAQAANRTVGKLISNVLIKNENLSDGKPLFHADHNNIITGAGSNLSYENLKLAEQKLMLQTTPEGAAMGLRGAYLVVPVALMGLAELLVSEQLVIGGSGAFTQTNTLSGRFKVIADPNLDADSAIKWYLVANYNEVGTIERSYLDGEKAPFIDQREGWEIDGIEFKVRQDIGANALDYRGMVRGAGTPA